MSAANDVTLYFHGSTQILSKVWWRTDMMTVRVNESEFSPALLAMQYKAQNAYVVRSDEHQWSSGVHGSIYRLLTSVVTAGFLMHTSIAEPALCYNSPAHVPRGSERRTLRICRSDD